MEAYIQQTQGTGRERLIRAIEILCALEADMKWSTQPRVLLEMALVRICRPEQEETLDALMDRMEKLEQQISEGMVIQKVSSPADDLTESDVITPSADIHEAPLGKQPAIDIKDDDVKTKKKTKSHKEEIDDGKLWAKVLKTVKKERIAIYGLLVNCTFKTQGDGKAVLYFPVDEQFAMETIDREENRSFIEEILEKLLGRQVKLRCRMLDETKVDDERLDENIVQSDSDEIIEKAIDLFGRDFVEVVDE
jgi:DNA polymerase-3 subunit gamma/tau